jgi:hypothetical protein
MASLSRMAGHAPPAGADELYDLADDPGETRNLAAQHRDIVRDMSALLKQLRR